MARFNRKCRLGAVILIFCLLMGAWGFTLPVSALSETAPEEERVGAAYLCNLENNLVLYEKNGDTPVYPAASVKIMTGLLACRALADRLDEEITVTTAMLAGASGRQMQLAEGETLTVRDLLFGSLCGGYNDATCALAYLTAGSVAAFVDQMNTEAARLGASSTVYVNPTGLHHDDAVTTAADTARIAQAAFGNDLFMDAVSALHYTVPATNCSEKRQISNRNSLLSDTSNTYFNGYCRGMNAGMIDESLTGRNGWCVVTVWEKNGVTNLAVVMEGQDVDNGETIPAYRYVNRLLSWADRNYGYRTVLTAGQSLGTYPVAMTGVGSVETKVSVPENVSLYLPRDADIDNEISLEVTLDGDGLTAPLSENQRVGTVMIMYGGQTVGAAPVIVTEAFTRSGFLDAMEGFKNYLTGRAFIATVAAFLVMILIYARWNGHRGRRYHARAAQRKSATYKSVRRYK